MSNVAQRTAGLVRMRPRDPHEPHRVASTLELFFDLTFVVGVSVAATQLLHAEESGTAIGVARFLLAFFAVWWAWVIFTWFASAFDTTIPIALFLLATWLMVLRQRVGPRARVGIPALAVLIGLAAFLPAGLQVAAALVVLVVVVLEVDARRA